jgi:threonine synthase
MNWISTRGRAPAATFRDALFEGLAPDGGLYLPERIEPLSQATLDALRGASLPTVGATIAVHLIENEIPRTAIEQIVAQALDFPIPLVPVGPGTLALELFHGPTFAFKDVGARSMARLMAYFVERGDHFTVLVATSGDTGSAVAQAFAGLAGTRVVVLFPEGQVSAVQEAQFATIGGNVRAVAVQGTFDDCQAMVKEAFADTDLRRRVRLTSANSINVGRLVPQIFYYAWASLEAVTGFSRSASRRAIFSVPSGNFGNLTGGLIAKRLGLPIEHFIAATNVNDVVPEYLASGVYAPRPSVRTIANAMDVGAPSNFERMRALYGDNVERLRNDIRGAAFDDMSVRRAIGDVAGRYGRVLDPHSAIAWLGLQGQPGIFLATAHPAKFREVVEPVIGRRIDLPAALGAALERARQITRIQPRYADLRDKIL